MNLRRFLLCAVLGTAACASFDDPEEGSGGLALTTNLGARYDATKSNVTFRVRSDHATRVQLYYKAQETLVNDAVEVWGHSDFSPETVSKKVGGYKYCPIMGLYVQPLWLSD